MSIVFSAGTRSAEITGKEKMVVAEILSRKGDFQEGH
jgi:hypothetical protein